MSLCATYFLSFFSHLEIGAFWLRKIESLLMWWFCLRLHFATSRPRNWIILSRHFGPFVVPTFILTNCNYIDLIYYIAISTCSMVNKTTHVCYSACLPWLYLLSNSIMNSFIGGGVSLAANVKPSFWFIEYQKRKTLKYEYHWHKINNSNSLTMMT